MHSAHILHHVPHGFVFPSYSCKTMWGLWFFGNPRDGICAYKNISAAHDLQQGKCKINFSRTKQIMDKLMQIAISGVIGSDGVTIVGIITRRSDLTIGNSASVYDYAYPKLLRMLYRTLPERPADKNINTLANRKDITAVQGDENSEDN